MTPEELRMRLAFLGFTEADRENLAELAPILEKNADSFIGAFYRHLLSFEPTRRLLADPEVKESLTAMDFWQSTPSSASFLAPNARNILSRRSSVTASR